MTRILRISRVVADLARAEAFLRDGLGFHTVSHGPADGAFGAADEMVMRLGDETLALVCFAEPGRAPPGDSQSNDLWFQHLAIVVSDMDMAYAHLSTQAGWTAITRGGPQTLPPENGAVRAFKFRDPDGHPLELIWFPPGTARPVWSRTQSLFLGIDHSALAVASIHRSQNFYEALGLNVASRSLNEGPVQSRLDGLAAAKVEVVGLRPASDDGPGLEMLAYHPPGRAGAVPAPQDLVTDWVTLAVSSESAKGAVRDPDGHLLLLVDQGMGAPV